MTQKRRSGSSLFDRFAEAASEFAAHAVFFIACLALLQNSQRRSDDAVHQKLDAIADGLTDLMENLSSNDDGLRGDTADLRQSVGVERP